MKVKDLKLQLQDLDDELEVIVKSDNYELQGSYVLARGLFKTTNKYKKQIETFIDDFDHMRYNKEIFISSEDDFMNIDRDILEKISKENNIKTVDELLRYIDHEDFFKLVYEKRKELENGIMRFRYNDREELLYNYKKGLYNTMIIKGRILNKEECGIIEKAKNDIKYVCKCVFECEYQKYDPKLQTNLCSDNDEDCKYCIKIN